MAAKPKQVKGLQCLINKRVTLTDLGGDELNKDITLMLKGFDPVWLEVENYSTNKVGFFNTASVSFITEHKEQP